jgi:hypothetical protein
MSGQSLEHLIECQSALIAALDKRDPAAIETAIRQLEIAAASLQKFDVWQSRDETRMTIEHGLKQCNAARTRINYLSEWTRQNIERLNGLRGISRTDIYSNPQSNVANRSIR